MPLTGMLPDSSPLLVWQEEYNDFSLLLSVAPKSAHSHTPNTVLANEMSSMPGGGCCGGGDDHFSKPPLPLDRYSRRSCDGKSDSPLLTSGTAGVTGKHLTLGTLLENFFAVDRRDLSCEKCKHAEAQVEVSVVLLPLQ